MGQKSNINGKCTICTITHYHTCTAEIIAHAAKTEHVFVITTPTLIHRKSTAAVYFELMQQIFSIYLSLNTPSWHKLKSLFTGMSLFSVIYTVNNITVSDVHVEHSHRGTYLSLFFHFYRPVFFICTVQHACLVLHSVKFSTILDWRQVNILHVHFLVYLRSHLQSIMRNSKVCFLEGKRKGQHSKGKCF